MKMSQLSNVFKTAILFSILTILLVLVGYVIGGIQGALVFLLLSLIMDLGTFWFSDKIAIAMVRGQEIKKHDFPELYEDVEEIAQKMQVPTPKLYISPQQQPNAFATGRNQKTSVVCFTRGIIEILNREELKGVIAHEIAHIKNRDVLLATIVAVIASAISSISQIGFFFGGNNEENRNPIVTLLVMIFAPIAAVLVQLAISRSREYLADATAASALGSGKGLANALLKIDKNIQLLPSANINPAFSSLFIANPLKGDDFLSIFSTHPPIKKRVEKLLQFDNVK